MPVALGINKSPSTIPVVLQPTTEGLALVGGAVMATLVALPVLSQMSMEVDACAVII